MDPDSHAGLLAIRNYVSQNPQSWEQNYLAPLEHQAFAREWTKSNPWVAAPSLAVATPAYSLAKLVGQPLGLYQDATPPSWNELAAGYRGIWEGLK